MGNCCQTTTNKEEFEVEVLQQSIVKQQGSVISEQLNSSPNKYEAAGPKDDQQNNIAQVATALEELKNSRLNRHGEDSEGGEYNQDGDYHGSNEQQQNLQNSLKNKFNLKIDLNKVNNDVSFTHNSEQDEPLMHRRKSSSENVHTQSQSENSQNNQAQIDYEQTPVSYDTQPNASNHNHNGAHPPGNYNKLTIEDTDYYEPYQGPPVPKKQLNIKLDLEKINEQNENEEYNPNSLKRKY